jgi:hypothetical protein
VTNTNAVLPRILIRFPSLAVCLRWWLIRQKSLGFWPPEDNNVIVIDRGSKCGRTGRKVSAVWEYHTNDIKSNTLPFVTCHHCMSTVSTGKKSERAVIHLNSCASFKLSMIKLDDDWYPDWFAASRPKKSAAGRASFVYFSRSTYSRMVLRTQTSVAKFTVTRLSNAIQSKINSSIAMHYYKTGTCYALQRMRTLSISYAEGFHVISCWKIEYDKSS